MVILTKSGNGCGPRGPLLENGDSMKQPEFHRRYSLYPEDVKVELVGGIVYMASPLRWRHGTYAIKVGALLNEYSVATPGVEAGAEATAILGEESEPQPDITLRINQESGGQSTLDENQYVIGSSEMFVEIAHSTRAIDMNQKRGDYERAGVLEYVVLCVEEQEIHWFHFPSGGRIRANREGVFRSKVFPGLWLNGPALLALDYLAMKRTLEQGLASKAHAAFVKRLERARRRRP
jgi:Uma2 family endonuclease